MGNCREHSEEYNHREREMWRETQQQLLMRYRQARTCPQQLLKQQGRKHCPHNIANMHATTHFIQSNDHHTSPPVGLLARHQTAACVEASCAAAAAAAAAGIGCCGAALDHRRCPGHTLLGCFCCDDGPGVVEPELNAWSKSVTGRGRVCETVECCDSCVRKPQARGRAVTNTCQSPPPCV